MTVNRPVNVQDKNLQFINHRAPKNSKLRNIKQYYCACATTMDYTIECKAI